MCQEATVWCAYLGAGAGEVRAEHDGPRGVVVKLAASVLEAVLEQLDVATAAVAALLVLDLVLDDQGLDAEANCLLEGSRDGVVGRLRLCDEALVAVDGGPHGGLFYGPLADIGPGLAAGRGLLGRLRRRPPGLPVIGELLKERRLDGRGLREEVSARKTAAQRVHTVNLGRGASVVSAGADDEDSSWSWSWPSCAMADEARMTQTAAVKARRMMSEVGGGRGRTEELTRSPSPSFEPVQPAPPVHVIRVQVVAFTRLRQCSAFQLLFSAASWHLAKASADRSDAQRLSAELIGDIKLSGCDN